MSFIGDDAYLCDLNGKWIHGKAAIQDEWSKMLADPTFKADIVSRIPLGRVGETKDLVGPAIFLCSDAASFVTGQILGIDGGLTATQ